MAEPAGPMTFRCPLAVRSTCPPARCTAATISLACLDRQRFGLAGFFSAIPSDLSIPGTGPCPPSWTAHRLLASLQATGQCPRATPMCTGHRGRSSRSVRAGSMSQRSRTGSNGAQRSPTVQRNRRSSPLRLRQQAEPPARVPYSGTAIAVWIGSLGASSSTTWSLFPVPGGRHRLPWALARTEGGVVALGC